MTFAEAEADLIATDLYFCITIPLYHKGLKPISGMKKQKKKKDSLNRTDALAIERTRLANERTFLAYFRTFIVFVSSGFAILKMEVLKEIIDIGYFLSILAPLLLLVGILRFFYVKRQIRKFYYPRELTDLE